jgi:hypothetical protein
MLEVKRSAAFGGTVGLALGLHAAAAVGLAAVMSSAPPPDVQASARPALEVHWVNVVDPQPMVGASVALPAAQAQSCTPVAGAEQPTPAAPAGLRGPEFLTTGEVDQPARPAQAWAIDAEGLAALGITRIVFDTWVDAQAAVAALRVVAMEPASTASLLPLVEARLAGTAMLAARKDGKPVAHQQRIDLAWQRAAAGRPG